jgi:ribosomal protein S25
VQKKKAKKAGKKKAAKKAGKKGGKKAQKKWAPELDHGRTFYITMTELTTSRQIVILCWFY